MPTITAEEMTQLQPDSPSHMAFDELLSGEGSSVSMRTVSDSAEHDCSGRSVCQSWFSRLASKLVVRQLNQLTEGKLCLRIGCHEAVFGDHNVENNVGIVNLKSDRFFSRLMLGGGLGAAESFMDGEWTSPDLVTVFRTLLRNKRVIEDMRTSRFSPIGLLRKLEHFRNRNSKGGSQKNIHEHYDLGNEFFSLFLDDSMMYSSALFNDESTPLETASWEKVDRVCRQLQITPKDHIIEIGTGWGGFALHAASKYGCRVTTTTISNEQFQFAQSRIADAGLSDRVSVTRTDYRDLEGRYDKLVSLEMIEAVGREFLPEYFRTCSRLLKDDGAMMIQSIVMPEQGYEAYTKSVDFIQKYIFPGGFLPCVTEMQRCVSDHTDLRLLELNDFGHHYARTLNLWNRRFHERLNEVRAQGFDERFIRMWRYYLSYCEAAFLERATGLVQVVWGKPNSSLGRLKQSS